MNIAEWHTANLTAARVTVVLLYRGEPAVVPVPVARWVTGSDGRATAKVMFGPYAETVRATALLLDIDDGTASDVREFGDELVLPAGTPYEVTVNQGTR